MPPPPKHKGDGAGETPLPARNKPDIAPFCSRTENAHIAGKQQCGETVSERRSFLQRPMIARAGGFDGANACQHILAASVQTYPVMATTPWSVANQLQGLTTGAFSCQDLPLTTDQLRLDPTESCAPGRRCDRVASVCHLALCMFFGISRHATNPPGLSRMHTNNHHHSCPHPTYHIYDQLHTYPNCD